MPVVQRKRARLFYEDTGSGDPPLLFVHGLGVHEHFRPQIDFFAGGHRVIAPDLPGFGRSDAPPREYGVQAYAEDIAWLCGRLDLHGPVIVGHSLAGAVAVELAATHPHLPSALVLIDPIPIVAAPQFPAALGPFVEALAGAGYRDAIREYAHRRMFRPTDEPDLQARIIDDMAAVPQHVVAPVLASALRWNGEHAARRVEVPVLLITAGDGIPSDMARIREILPQLELGRTVGSGHFAHVMVPDQVNGMIRRFLAVSRALTTH
jgi:pimeloyl-ACP methyl ester carboxylesterase